MLLVCNDELALLGVFDGHGSHGHYCSYIVQQTLPRLVLANGNFASDTELALKEAFRFANDALKDIAEKQGSFSVALSGTTATVVVVRKDGSSGRQELYVGHVGDSRAVLGRRVDAGSNKIEPVTLTRDHTPGDPWERQRIEKCEGDIRKSDDSAPARFYCKGANYPGLSLSRSIGDEFSKPYGVTAQPDTVQTDLDDADLFVVLCSDGVWERLPTQEVVDIVHKHGKEQAKEATKEIVERARQKWKELGDDWCDDITCVIYYLQ